MNGLVPLLRKELQVSFATPAAWLILIIFPLFSALWLFFVYVFPGHDRADFGNWFIMMTQLLILVLPAITMALWAEERKLGTEELLLTLPVSVGTLVTAKYLSASLRFLMMILLTLPLPLSLLELGNFDTGRLVSEYLGLVLFGLAALSAGLFTSTLAKSQAASFLSGMLLLLVLSLSHRFSVRSSLPAWIGSLTSLISLEYRFDSFRRGVVNTADAAWFLFVTGSFLLLSTAAAASRRGR